LAFQYILIICRDFPNVKAIIKKYKALLKEGVSDPKFLMKTSPPHLTKIPSSTVDGSFSDNFTHRLIYNHHVW
jgi:hypothetical protein